MKRSRFFDFFDVNPKRDRVFLSCLIAVILALISLSFGYYELRGWLLEAIAVVALMAIMLYTHRFFRFSNFSYLMLTLFAFLSLIGGHFLYSRVPLGPLVSLFPGTRNPYDRIVHFGSGFFLSYPFMELWTRTSNNPNTRRIWRYIIPIFFALGLAAVYEVIEWGAAAFSPATEKALELSGQGDAWDAQKDMMVAGLGAVITMGALYVKERIINGRIKGKSMNLMNRVSSAKRMRYKIQD